jgi:hypothetical protein
MPTLGKTKVSPSLISTGSLFLGTSSYAVTASFALNASGGGGGGSVQTGSIAKQTILYNVTSGSQNVITGLNLSSNKWGVDIKEEWDAKSITGGDQYYPSCSLLMHFNGSNGSTTFIDNSPRTKTFTVNGNSQISTAQSKFGGASAYFDGTGDYLSTNSSNNFAFGTGDFTVEFWIYSSDVSSATQRGFLQTSNTAGGLKPSYTTGIAILQGANNSGGQLNGGLYANIAGTGFGSTTAVISTNTWYHIALVRNSGTSTLYVNGTSVGTASTTGNCSGTYLSIGGYESTSFLYQGYLDELRITKAVARYTTNFTPQTSEFPNSQFLTQYATKYIGLIGGLNDKSVDYGVQKLSDSSLKVVKMTQTTSPFPSGSLSASVDRVYVNVLDYTKVSVTSSYARNALSASYLIPTSNNTTKAIFGYGYIGGVGYSMTNLVSNTGVVANDVTGVGTARWQLAAAGYGVDKAIFGYGWATSAYTSITNLVSNTGVVATDTTGVGTAREALAAAGYGNDKAIFGYGTTGANVSLTNLVSNTGVVATDTTGVGSARASLAAAGYGVDKAIFGYGYTSANVSLTNLVSNTGVVATDTTGVGTARRDLRAARYGNDKAIFGYGLTSVNVSITNLVSNVGVVASDTTGVGTARSQLAAAGYGVDKAIFGYGYTSTELSMVNLVSNTGVVANDTLGVGTSRRLLAAAGYSTT